MNTIKLDEDSVVELRDRFYKFDFITKGKTIIQFVEIPAPNPMPEIRIGMQCEFEIDGDKERGVIYSLNASLIGPRFVGVVRNDTPILTSWVFEKHKITKLWDYKNPCIWERK